MILDYFFLSFNNLRKRKLRSWLTMLGIFIGITAVVALIGLGEGLKAAVSSQFGISNTEVLTVQAGGLSGAGPPGTGVVNPLTEDDAEEIGKLTGVERAIPRLISQGKLEFNDHVSFSYAMSIPEGEDRKFAYDVLELEAIEGRLLKDGDTNKVVLGYNFYSDDVGLGKEIHPGDNVIVQGKKFEVVGLTKKKGSFIFDNLIHIQEDEMRDLFNIKDKVDVIAVQVKNKDEMDKTKEDIEKLLRKRRNVKEGEEDFSVETPDSILDDINTILVGVQIFIVIIASISILVGALGIVNTMYTSVMERRKQIGIMKSIGGTNRDIFILFFIESGLMGLIGGLVGTVIGTLISMAGVSGINAWINASISLGINFYVVFGALFGSFLLGSISGVLPALSAAKLKPVDALRK